MPTKTEPWRVLSTFGPVLPADEHILSAYAYRFYRTRVASRFYLTPTYLAAQPSVYRVGSIQGCLVLLKRRVIIGNRVLYLVMPPISWQDNPQVELSVMEWLRSYGVSTMLSADDRGLYGYAPTDAPPDQRWPEFAYSAATHANPVGAAGKNIRAARNQMARLAAAGDIEVVSTTAPDAAPLEALARVWHRQTRRHAGEARLVRTFAQHAKEGLLRRRALIVYRDGRPIAHSLTEEVTPGRVTIVSRLRDYTDTSLPDPTLALHTADCVYWNDVHPGTILTSGSAATPGLVGHKDKLRPVQVTPLGRLTVPRQPTKDEFDATKAGTP